MRDAKRTMAGCTYRRPQSSGPKGAGAICELVRELTGVEDAQQCAVARDVCQACCRWHAPSPEHINPVVASLLYSVSSSIAASGGVEGCESGHAARLQELAVENLTSDDEADGHRVQLKRAGSDSEQPSSHSLQRLIPRPARRCGPRIRRWAVGVTTAPREQPTLEACLESLRVAGWAAPRLFVDGDVPIPKDFRALPVTARAPQVGAWPNYYLALVELLMREPHADAYLLMQDDALLCAHPGLREYLEAVFWPGGAPGLASLFCSRADTRPAAGWYRFRGAWVWTALAFVFAPAAAQRFVADLRVVRHRLGPAEEGLAHVDVVLGRWAQRARVPLYYPTPSLVQHIGHVSSLWKNLPALGDRRASWFADDGRDE